MNIIEEKEGKLYSLLKVSVEPTDYQEKVDVVLKDYRKKVSIPGFRQGKTPMSIITKRYKPAVVADEVNKLIQSELYKFILDNKLKVLGSPLMKPTGDIDWEKDSSFNFEYEVGISPEFEISITKKNQLDYYKIFADDKLIDTYVNDIAKRYGKMNNPEVSSDGDLLFCNINQIDIEGNLMENGIKNEATVSMDFIATKKIKDKFIGLKKDDAIIVDVSKAFTNQADLSALLGIKKEEIEDLESKEFQFTVKNVSNLEPATIDVELFKKVYPKDEIKSEKEFRNKIKEEAETSFLRESDRMLKNDVVSYLLKNTKFDIPDDFLKRWLVHTSKEPITFDEVEKEYDMYSKSLRWQLLESKILEMYEIKVSEEELESHTKKLIGMQMSQYGQPIPEEEKMNEIVKSFLEKEDEKKKIYDQLYDIKTLDVYKQKFKLKDKSISYDDFVKLASEK